MTLALLCSGQGRQHPAMFDLTGAAVAAQPLFAHAAGLLRDEPRRWIGTRGSAELHANRPAQLLCTLQALSAAAALADVLGPLRLCVAGYSVGEVAAWGVAGLLTGAAALDLVEARAVLMNEARHGEQGMLFVRGLPRTRVDACCAGRNAAVAIINPGDALVLGGARADLETIAQDALQQGASRVVPVGVDVASHTRLMAAAVAPFRERLAAAAAAPAPRPGVRLFSGIDGATVLNVTTGLDKLAAQLAAPVDWAACLEACVETGATAFLELGPGRALAEMAAGAYPQLPARSLDDFRSLEGARRWIVQMT